MDSKHDAAFLEILREEKNVTNFFDAVFGFLYRCTDFYIETPPGKSIGFPPGVAEQIVVQASRKWQNLKKEESLNAKTAPATDPVTADKKPETKGNSESSTTSSKRQPKAEESGQSAASDCYNGASYENYKWSQSISDLDVLVRVPEEARSSKQVRVELLGEELEVAVLQTADDKPEPNWQVLLKGRFSFKINTSESYWCLEPGKHVSLHLEKATERWWESLLDGEPRIELSKIDCTRNLEEMAESEQMKLEELVWNQKRKLLGQPTSEQMRMEQILQKAWNADGSPFRGTEYDPSIVKFN